MTVPDWVASRIRTVWPMAIGLLASWLLVQAAPLVAWLRDTFGVTVTDAQVAAVLAVALGYAVYEAGRRLEARNGDGRFARLARLVGRLVLSIGLPTGQPTYPAPARDRAYQITRHS